MARIVEATAVDPSLTSKAASLGESPSIAKSAESMKMISNQNPAMNSIGKEEREVTAKSMNFLTASDKSR
jgi:hypothetical protein